MTMKSNSEKDNFERLARQRLEMKSLRVAQQYTTTILKIMEADIFPEIGRLDVSRITTLQLLPVLQLVEENHGTELAHRICSLCGEVFTQGIVEGACIWNPATIVRDALSQRIYRRSPIALTADKVREVVSKIGEYSASPVTGAALRLSVFLLARPGRLCRAEWKDLNWDKAVWTYELPTAAEARGGWGSHYVPLSAQAVRVFQELQAITGSSRYVFATAQSPERPIWPQALRRSLQGMGLEREITGSNVFRTSARALLCEELHIPPQIVNQQLGHAIRDRKECDINCSSCLLKRRQMMQKWSDYIERFMFPGTLPESVTFGCELSDPGIA